MNNIFYHRQGRVNVTDSNFKSVILLVLLSLIYISTQGQGINVNKKDVSLPSANATSLGRYGDYPTSLYNGTVDITIPLYELSERGLSVPVKLKFNTSGTRLDDGPSLVGLNWSLVGGGVIIRKINGLADESQGTHATNPSTPPLNENAFNNIPSDRFAQNADAYGYEEKMWEDPTHDWAPDEFTYSIGDEVGTFLIDISGNVITNSKYKIEYVYLAASAFSTFKEWKITTEDGTQYFFRQPELTYTNPISHLFPSGSGLTNNPPPSAWHLTSIVSRDGQSRIYFEYDRVMVADNYWFTDERYFEYATNSILTGCSGGGSTASEYDVDGGSVNHSFFYGLPILRKILSENFEIDFSYEPYNINATSKLTQVAINSRDGRLIRSYDMTYKTFGSRFLLWKIHQNDLPGSEALPYVFDYDETNIPFAWAFMGPFGEDHKSIAGIDHWGYYNGPTSGYNTRIPGSENIIFHGDNLEPSDLIAIDRTPNLTYAKAGSIKKITYPTGGYTQFDFELNDYSVTSTGQSYSSPKNGGGLRIKRITNGDGINPDMVKTYSYKTATDPSSEGVLKTVSETDVSSGVILSEPNYLFQYSSNGIGTLYGTVFNISMWRSNSISGIDIGYSHVTENFPDGSRIEYDYTTSQDYPYQGYPEDEYHVVEDWYGVRYYKKISHPFHELQGRFDYMRGQLKQKTMYSASGVMLNQTVNIYAARELGTLNWASSMFGVNPYSAFSCLERPVSLYFFCHYKVGTGRSELIRQETTISDGNLTVPTFSTVVQNIIYDPVTLQVAQEKKTSSEGADITTTYTYALNFVIPASPAGDLLGLKLLQDQNVINEVVESATFVNDPTLGQILQSSVYRSFKSNIPQEDKMYVHKIGSAFQPTYVSGNTIVKSLNYEEKIQYFFSEFGNTTSVKRTGNNLVSYVWGNKETELIAENTGLSNIEEYFSTVASQDIYGSATTPVFLPDNNEYIPPLGNSLGSFSISDNEMVTLGGMVSVINPMMMTRLSFVIKDASGNAVSTPIELNGLQNFSFGTYISLPRGSYSLFYYQEKPPNINLPSQDDNIKLWLYVGKFTRYSTVFHTSFEDEINAISSDYFKTGRKSHSGTYSIPLPYAAGSYNLTYWTESAGQAWIFHHEILNVSGESYSSMTIGAANTFIDEVRLWPVNSQLVTYTQIPGVGLIGQMDQNGKQTNYEYDPLGRLINITDNDGYVLKNYFYNYKTK